MAGLQGSRGLSPKPRASTRLIGLTRSAALDYAGQGIRIDAVFPGMNKTPMLVQQPARAYRPANSGVDR